MCLWVCVCVCGCVSACLSLFYAIDSHRENEKGGEREREREREKEIDFPSVLYFKLSDAEKTNRNKKIKSKFPKNLQIKFQFHKSMLK